MTSETNDVATGRRRYCRLLKWTLILIGTGLCFWSGAWLNDRIQPVKRYGHTGEAERNFNVAFPTEKDIESYLSNATILVSDMSFGQSVYYFDEPHHFLKWRNDGSSRTDLLNGGWFTKWYLLPMELKGQWRIALVYSFCKWFPDSEGGLAQDSCVIIENLNQLFAWGNAVREYRVGNVFKLSAGGSAPFPLPTRTRISIDGLLAIEKTRNGQ